MGGAHATPSPPPMFLNALPKCDFEMAPAPAAVAIRASIAVGRSDAREARRVPFPGPHHPMRFDTVFLRRGGAWSQSRCGLLRLPCGGMSRERTPPLSSLFFYPLVFRLLCLCVMLTQVGVAAWLSAAVPCVRGWHAGHCPIPTLFNHFEATASLTSIMDARCGLERMAPPPNDDAATTPAACSKARGVPAGEQVLGGQPLWT